MNSRYYTFITMLVITENNNIIFFIQLLFTFLSFSTAKV